MYLPHFASTLSFVSLALAWTTYIVPHSAGGGDDTPALAQAFTDNPSLATDSTILFQQGVTYNILTPICLPHLENVIVSVQGNLTYSADIKTTQDIVGSSSYPGDWFKFSGGSNVTLTGSMDPSWGWINCNGQQWWDEQQTKNRPRVLGFNGIVKGEIMYLKVSQPVASSFCVSGSNIHIHNNMVKAISASKAFPYNTDGFDVQGTDILIEENIIYNGDDCLAVNSPAENICFRNNYCNGGHGASVGSLGKYGAVANVQNILIENNVLEDSTYGARFKSWSGGKGFAKNLTWNNITMTRVKYPIYVIQNYTDSHSDYKPSSTSTGSTEIDGLTFQGIRGTLDDVSQGPGALITLDLYEGDSSAIFVEDIQMNTLSGKPAVVKCDPDKALQQMGFECCIGCPFTPTAVEG